MTIKPNIRQKYLPDIRPNQYPVQPYSYLDLLYLLIMFSPGTISIRNLSTSTATSEASSTTGSQSYQGQVFRSGKEGDAQTRIIDYLKGLRVKMKKGHKKIENWQNALLPNFWPYLNVNTCLRFEFPSRH